MEKYQDNFELEEMKPVIERQAGQRNHYQRKNDDAIHPGKTNLYQSQ